MSRIFRRAGAVVAAVWLAVGPALAPLTGAGSSVHAAGAAQGPPAAQGVGTARTAYHADGGFGVHRLHGAEATTPPCPPVAALSTADTPDFRIQPTAPVYLLAEPTGSGLLTALEPTRGPHAGAAGCIDGSAADRHGATGAVESRIRAIQRNALSYLADHAAMRAGLRSARSTAPAPPLGSFAPVHIE